MELLKRFAPANFNDFLCLFILGLIFTLWILSGSKVFDLNQEILGATIAFFTIIGQYYFRKAKEEK
jgi:hypothetical protein